MATFSRRQPPPKPLRNYKGYRERVREDFGGYCAYCGVHESDWHHGAKNYVLDHFRPRALFDEETNNFYNLRWCCHICNRTDAKGDAWPSTEEQAEQKCFVDLCEDDWQKHYKILPTGIIEAVTSQAEYTIAVIGLNNPDYVEHRLQILQKGRAVFPHQP